MRSRRLYLLPMALICSGVIAAPSVDSVHKLMEPAAPRERKPRIHNPIVGKPAGVMAAVQMVASPKRAIMLLPAVMCTMAVASPDLLTRILVQLMCYLGSLFEPLETFLPEKGVLRALVTTVQQAKKAYNVKHGLVSIDEQQFFDDEDEEPDAPRATEATNASETTDDDSSKVDDSEREGDEDGQED